MKKETLKVIIIATVLTALLVGCLYLANRHRFAVRKEKTFGIVNSMYQIEGNYIYFNHNGKLMRFDTASDTLSPDVLVDLCTDPECDGSCPLENVTYFSRIYKNCLYFLFIDNNSHGLACYNLKTEKTEVIKRFTELGYHELYVYDDYIYVIFDQNDYRESTVFRLPVSGGEVETVIEFEANERPIMIADGEIFTQVQTLDHTTGYSTIYYYDIKTLERRELWHSDTERVYLISSRAQFYDGKMYFMIRTDEVRIGSLGVSYLCCLDVQSGNASYVFDIPITSFALTYEGIYLETNERKEIPTETILSGKIDTYSQMYKENSIALAGHGGKGIKILYENDEFLSYSGYYANGKFIGQVKYESTNKNSGYFIIIDLMTGDLNEFIIGD